MRQNLISGILYLLLVVLLVMFLLLHAFMIQELETGSFTRFLISLVVVVLLLPSVFRVKIFDLIEVTRKAAMFQKTFKDNMDLEKHENSRVDTNVSTLQRH